MTKADSGIVVDGMTTLAAAKHILEYFKERIRPGVVNSYVEICAGAAAIGYSEGRLTSYKDYYGMVLTQKFRDRLNIKIDFWDSIVEILNDIK